MFKQTIIFILVFGIILSQIQVYAQNLIRNGDFEMENSKGEPAYWHTGEGTPDYLNSHKMVKECGRLLAGSRPNFVGTYFDDKWQEYIISNLRTELVPQTNYSFSCDLFLELACVSGFDTLFLMMSTDTLIDENDFLLEIPINHVELGKWTHLQKDFVADRPIKYFALGCFEKYSKNIRKRGRPKLEILQKTGKIPCSYMFFDNISLTTENIVETIPDIDINSIFFDTGKFKINQESKIEIEKIVSKFKQKPNQIIELIGYTDDVGIPERNFRLSRLRVKEVKKTLIKLGIPPQYILTQSLGEIQLQETNNKSKERKANRRVDIRFL